MQMNLQYTIPNDVLNVINSMLSGATESEPCKQVAFRIAAFAYNDGINVGLDSALEQLEETHLFIRTLTEQHEEIAS
jgi:hypothetical protein